MVIVIPNTLLMLVALIIISLVYSVAEETKLPKDDRGELINHLLLTHYDDWNVNATCPTGLYMVGIRLRHEVREVQKKNTSTVTGFELLCSNGIFANNKTVSRTTFGKGRQSTWSKITTECPTGFVTGISATLSPSDVFGRPYYHILSLQMTCSGRDGTWISTLSNYGIKEVKIEGSREFEQFCNRGEAVTAISIKADSVVTFYEGESTSVKGYGLQCRIVENPASKCSIIFRWETRPVVKCPQIVSKTPDERGKMSNSHDSLLNCTFQTWIGIGPNENKDYDAPRAIKSFSSLGAKNNDNFVKWIILKKLLRTDIKQWFATKFPDKPRLLDVFASERLWTKLTDVTGQIDFQYQNPLIPSNLFLDIRNEIDLNFDPSLEQLVGHCSFYKIYFDLFKPKNEVYFQKAIKNRLTRIIFELY